MPVGRLDKSRALLYSLLLHAGIAVLLTSSIDFGSAPNPYVGKPIIQARAVDQQALEEEIEKLKAVERKKELAAENKRKEAEKKVKEAEEKRRDEEAKLKKLKAEQRRIETDKQAAIKRIETEKKRLAQQKKELATQQRKAEDNKKRAAEEKRKLAEERDRAIAEARERELNEALAAEEDERAAALRRQQDEREIDRYIAAIRDRVAGAFIYPDFENGLKCTLYVRMIPGGEVVEARVIEPSGNAAFDRQAENAVRKAAPLPVASDPRLFRRMREIRFVFDPESVE